VAETTPAPYGPGARFFLIPRTPLRPILIAVPTGRRARLFSPAPTRDRTKPYIAAAHYRLEARIFAAAARRPRARAPFRRPRRSRRPVPAQRPGWRPAAERL